MSTPHGLDVNHLTTQLGSHTRKVTSATDMIRTHLRSHRGYVAWSGGKDSTAVAHLAVRASPDVPLVFFDSGLEFPETIEYVNELANQWGANLHVVAAEPDALSILKATGGWDHTATPERDIPDLFEATIAAPSRASHDLHGNGEITGLRADESRGRGIHLTRCRGVYTRDSDGVATCAPAWNWTDGDVRGYLASNHIPLNPVYDRLASLGAPPHAQRVGMVIDGTALHQGRAVWLKRGWPSLYADLLTHLPRLAEWA